jgi:polyketide synthase 12
MSRPVFVFSGQGSQWAGMGRELLERWPVSRAVLEACDAQVRERVGWSLLEALTAGEERARLGHIEVSCPAIVSMELALAALWRSWGVEPAAVVGHSIGEVAAAHVAGALSLEEAMRIICHLGRTISRTRGQGAMAVVGLSWERAGEVVAGREDRLWRAIHASPGWTVLAAPPEVLEAKLAELRQRGVPCRRVESEVAAHCPLVEPLREVLCGLLEGLEPRRASVPFFSTVTGGELSGEQLGAAYWGRNLADPVLFSEAVEALLARGHDTFLEVSPHPLVKHSLESCLRHAGREGTLLASMRRGRAPGRELSESLERLAALGARVTPPARGDPEPTPRARASAAGHTPRGG